MQSKMHARSSFLPWLLLLAVCAAFTALASAQMVDTEPRSITVVENQENVNLHCRIGRPAQLCVIRMPGVNDQFSLDPNLPSPVAGMQYYGEGLPQGSCGVRIDRVSVDNAGLMNCTLFVDGRGLTGAIEIVVAFPPEQPVIEVRSGNLANVEVNSELTFQCEAARGNPAANISWFLDQEQIYEGVRPVEPEEYFDEGVNKRFFTAKSVLTRSIRAEDNGKRLTCQAQHLAYPEGVSRTDLILNVNFQPQALPDQTVYGLQLGRTATVSVVIKANPAPRILWTVDGIDYQQGMEQGRYAVPLPEGLGNNRYNVSLTIAGLTLEDLSKVYTMRASNNFGTEDYRLNLRSQEEIVNESSGVGIGEIVGLVLAVLIVLTAVALIFVARATGRWCFRGASLNTDINPDSEAQITPHPHDDEIDEKLQTQDPAAHFVHEGDEKHAATNGKHENGKQTKAQQQQQQQQQAPPAAVAKQENGKADSKNSSTSTSAAKIGETSDTESAEVKQPMTKTQRLKNIFARRVLRPAGSELPEETAEEPTTAVDERDTKLTADPSKTAKDDQTLVYAELELKPAGGEISFVNKPPPPTNESTEYAEILYVQQQAGGAASAGTTGTEPAQPVAPMAMQQPRLQQHSGEDNRPVIDGSILKPGAKGDGSKTAGK